MRSEMKFKSAGLKDKMTVEHFRGVSKKRSNLFETKMIIKATASGVELRKDVKRLTSYRSTTNYKFRLLNNARTVSFT